MRLVLDARTASFGALIDYAGVFPPASLSVADAVTDYRRVRRSDDRWTIGRFLIRATQLEQLGAVATGQFTRGEKPWDVSVIFDASPGACATMAADFHAEMAPVMRVSAAEVKMPDTIDGVEDLLDTVAIIDPDVSTFVEVSDQFPLRDQLESIETSLRVTGSTGGAKIRCGGVTPDLFPTVERLAGFIWEASLSSLPFKATAGLHQPIRHHDDALDVWRHGFVNILVASVAADAGEDRETVEAIVGETESDAFEISATAARWKDVVLPGSAVRRSRTHGFTAYGSCDADEPLEALTDYGFLGDGT